MWTLSRIAQFAGAVVIGLGVATPAFALVTTETDRPTWETAVGGTIVNDPFATPITQGMSIMFDSGVVSTVTVCCSFADENVVRNPPGGPSEVLYQNRLGPDGTGDQNWTFPMLVNGFGADWGGVQNVVVTILGESFEIDSVVGASDGFLGFVSDTPFMSVDFTHTSTNPSARDIYTADNLAFSKAAVVPEPATVTLFAIGLLGVGLTLRRRTAR